MGVNGIYGLSGSGLDVESMVKVGMLSKQSQYDKMQQKYTKNEWTKAAYVEMYGKVQTFNNSTLSQYKMSANMNARTAESSNSEIKASANASAPNMTHYVEVGKAATNAYLIGTNSVERLGSSQTSTQLRDALFNSLTAVGDNITTTDSNGNTSIHGKNDVAFKFSVGDGKTGGVIGTNPDAATASLTASAVSGDYKVNVTQLATAAEMKGSAASMTRYGDDGSVMSGSTSSALKNLLFKNLTIENNKVTSYESLSNSGGSATLSASGTAAGFTLSDGTNSAAINITYNKIANGYSLEDLASDINNAGLNITASYDAETQEFSLINSETGSSNEISITTTYNNNGQGNYAGNATAALLNNLGLGSFSTNSTTSVSGQDAQLTINDEAVTSSTNTVTKDGINFNLEGVGESNFKIDTSAAEKTTVSITYGQLAEGYTFNDLTAAVNSLGTNVKATYDSVNDKFSFYNSESGKENAVALVMADENDGGANATKFFNQIGLKQSANGELSENALSFESGKAAVAAGTNSQVKVDGVDYDISDNKLTVNGVTYNFVGATEGAKSTVTITQDTDKIIDKVKSFVEDYNKLLKTLTDAYNEKPNSNYKPLTESQKDAMKDEQIEKWEEKAKAGLLYHDSTIGKLITEMREAVSTPIDGVAGKYNSIFAIGISTKGIKGELTVDEDKLKAALNDDPDSVYNVFAKLDSNDMNNASKSGIAQRLGDVFMKNMKSIKSVSGTDLNTADDSDLSKLLRELQTKMSNFKAMMNAFEDKLYKKYDAMETGLARLGTQLNYVVGSFS